MLEGLCIHSAYLPLYPPLQKVCWASKPLWLSFPSTSSYHNTVEGATVIQKRSEQSSICMSDHASAALPTLGWVENGRFHPLQNVVLQSLMDCPVRSWDDFNGTDRKRLRNLKCMLPNGRLAPGQVPIVREFDRNWRQEWRATVWADGRKCIRVEHMVEEEDIVQEFDIDPTPAPTFIGDATYVISPDVTDLCYGGGQTTRTCLWCPKEG